MLGNLGQYKTKVKNDSLDYRLICVHVTLSNNVIIKENEDYWKPFETHIKNISKYANQNFKHKTIELIRTDALAEDIEPISTDSTGAVPSNLGEIEKEYIKKFNITNAPNIALVGYLYGACHKRTFEALINKGIKEIHIPQDGLFGIEKNCFPNINEEYKIDSPYFDYRDNPKVPIQREPRHFRNYVEAITKRQNFQLFIPQMSKPFIQDQKDEKKDILTVIIHKSWKDFVNFLDERN